MCTSIQTGILLGMNAQQNTPDVLHIAIKAFRDSLSFLQAFFDNPKILEFALDQLLTLCRKEDEDIAVSALVCLNDFVHIQYPKMGNYISLIYGVLVNHLMSNNPEIAMQAVDIWATIATKELENKAKYVPSFA